ncbi:MAG: hypothetical protein ABW133_03685 [Polyangiaceae bacterium]
MLKTSVARRHPVASFARVFVLAFAVACGGSTNPGFSTDDEGGAGAGGSSLSDASTSKDGAGGARLDGQSDSIGRNDTVSPPEGGGSGGTGTGGAAGSRADAGPDGASGRGGAAGSSGSGGAAGSGGFGGTGGTSGSGGAAGSGGAGSGGAAGDAGLPDVTIPPDASADQFDGSIVRDAGIRIDAPSSCDKPARAGGLFDDGNLAELAGVAHVTSGLTIKSAGLPDLGFLRCLQTVDGDFAIQDSDSLVTVQLAALQNVSGALRVEMNPSLTTIRLPALSNLGQSQGQSLVISSNVLVTSIAAPLLVNAPAAVWLVGDGANATAPTSLDLGALTTVGGKLAVNGNYRLETLAGLSHLATVSGDLAIVENIRMVEASLPALTTVSGSLKVNQQSMLSTIALPLLTTVGQEGLISVDFSGNAGLTSISVPSLTAVPAAFNLYNSRFAQGTADPFAIDFRALKTIGGPFSMSNVGDVENIGGFTALTSVGGQFTFDSVWAARSCAFPALATVGGSFGVLFNSALETAAFPSLASVGEGLRFHANFALSTIALPELKTVGVDQEVSVSFWQLSHLTSLSVPKLVSTPAQFFIAGLGDELPTSATTKIDFAALETVTGNFGISGLLRLASLGGFPALKTVTGDFGASSNPALVSVAFPALASVGGGVWFTDGDALSTISLPALKTVGHDAGGSGQELSLRFENLPALTSIAMQQLTEIPSTFYLRNASTAIDATKTLALDFPALTHIAKILEITETPRLRTLGGLAALAAVDGSILIHDNTGLQSVTLPALANVGGAIRIEQDEALSTIALPALKTIGQFETYSISFARLLSGTSIALPQLTTAQADVVFDEIGGAMPSPGTFTLDVGGLTTVGGYLALQKIYHLQRATFPKLASVRGFGIVQNDELTELSPPTSTATISLGSLDVVANAALPTCIANAFAMLFSGPNPPNIRDNKADACGG